MKIQLLNMNGQIYVYTNKSSENNNLIDASSSSGYERIYKFNIYHI